MSWTQEKIQETISQLQEKATSDASFRASLISNPNESIEKISGIQVPAGFKINVVDANEADLTIALPKMKSDELSDSDLESVAGGKSTGAIIGEVAADAILVGL